MLNFPGISSSWDIERETRRRRPIGKLKSGIHIRDDGGEFHFRWHVENSPSILRSLRREKPTERKMSLAGERVPSFVLLVTPPKSFMRANLRLFVLNLSTRSIATFPAFPHRDCSRDLSPSTALFHDYRIYESGFPSTTIERHNSICTVFV